MRAIEDFDPKQMNLKEKGGFKSFIRRFTLKEIRMDSTRLQRYENRKHDRECCRGILCPSALKMSH